VVEESSMSTTSTVPVPEAQAQPAISPFGRVVGVFFSPKATFEDIVRRPSWVLPFILLTIFSFVVCVAINQRINWREFMSQQIERSPQASQLSAEQKEQRIEGGAKFSPIFTYVVGICGPILFMLVVSLVLWGAYNLLGGANSDFGTAFGITSHAALTGLVSSILFLLVLYLKPYGTVDLENPVATNLAAVLPDDSAKWLVALCKSFDVFSIWTLILLAIGFAATSPKKLRGGKSFTIALSAWLVWVVVRTGVAFIFS
jgi:Yip1-like protein